MKSTFSPALFILVTATLVSSCHNSNKKENLSLAERRKPIIATVNYPLAYFAKRLSGEFADILFEIPPNVDPAYWNPTDDQVGAIQAADLVLLNGANYAKWTSSRTIPYEATVVTSSSFEDTFIELKEGTSHTHKSGSTSHTHGGFASTTWLDLELACKQASSTAEALCEQFPEHVESISRKLKILLEEMRDLDRKMKSVTAPLRGTTLVVSHPVFQYWTRAYGLSAHALHWEPMQKLGTLEMGELAAIQGEKSSVKYFIWEGPPTEENIKKIKMAGFINIVVNPCGARPAKGDFLSVMQENISSLSEAITQGTSSNTGTQ